MRHFANCLFELIIIIYFYTISNIMLIYYFPLPRIIDKRNCLYENGDSSLNCTIGLVYFFVLFMAVAGFRLIT